MCLMNHLSGQRWLEQRTFPSTPRSFHLAVLSEAATGTLCDKQAQGGDPTQLLPFSY